MKDCPALITAVFLIAGIIAGQWLRCPVPVLMIGLLCLFIFVLGCQRYRGKYPIQTVGAALLIAGTGCLRFTMANNMAAPDHYIRVLTHHRECTITAYLLKDPSVRTNGHELFVRATGLMKQEQRVHISGCILIFVSDPDVRPVQYGDEIQVTGRFEIPPGRRNPGGFDYRAYLQRRHIYGIVKTGAANALMKTGAIQGSVVLRCLVYPVRRWMINVIERTSSGEPRAILKALLLGDRQDLLPETRDRFSRAGVVHVLAVSGLHVGFVLLALTTLLGFFRFPEPVRIAGTMTGLMLFVLLTEGKPPVSRAALMGAVYLAGTLFQRRSSPLNAIGVAALILLLIRPTDLFDPGFQLSFGAVFSIVLIYPRLESLAVFGRLKRTFSRLPGGNGIWTLILVSLSAQIGTLPFTVSYFNRVPLLSIPANLIAVPLTGLVVALGFATLLAALFSMGAASLYGLVNQYLLSLFIWIFTRAGDFACSHVDVASPGFWEIGIYITCVIMLLHRSVVIRRSMVCVLLLLVNGLLWHRILCGDPASVTWIQFDVGQGDSALLRLPGNRTVLIDGGDRTPYYDCGERIVAPYLRRQGIRHLDAVVLTHPHNDHVGGLSCILASFRVGRVISAGTPCRSGPNQTFLETIAQRGIPHDIITAPDSLTAWPGVRLYFLAPTERMKMETGSHYGGLNHQSVVIQLHFGKTAFLFMGDAEAAAESHICRSAYLARNPFLKAGHHGSRTSSSDIFLKRIRPKAAVVSVGERNRFGHPSPVVMNRYRQLGIPLYRTDRAGAVIFRSDGDTVRQVMWNKCFNNRISPMPVAGPEQAHLPHLP